MRISSILRVFALTLVTCAFALMLSTCGGRHRVAPPDGSGGFQAAEGVGSLEAAPPTDISLDEALAELDALATPEGVDAALFEELKDALREALAERAFSVGAIHELPSGDKAGRGDPALQD